MLQSIFGSILGGFTNWKTTLVSVVAFLALVLHNYAGFDISVTQQSTIVAFTLLIVGWLAKDSTSTGTPQSQIDNG